MESACAPAVAAELQMLEAMYPGDLSVDPPTWHEGDDPQLPVAGSLQLPGSGLELNFRVRLGYPEKGSLEAHIFSAEASHDASKEFSAWVQSHLGDGSQSETALTDLLSAFQISLDELQKFLAGKAMVTESFVTALQDTSAGHSFAAPLPHGHSGLRELRVDRQWITFISFTSSKIAREFTAAADASGLTGFLMVGKPGISCLEGGPRAIASFLKEVRTDIFAQIDPAARKMSMSILEEACTRVRFEGFAVLNFPSAGSAGSAVDTGSAACMLTNKKRTARADLLLLKDFLISRGIVEKTFERVTMNVQHDV